MVGWFPQAHEYTQKRRRSKKRGGGKNIALGRPRCKRLNAGKYIQENFPSSLRPFQMQTWTQSTQAHFSRRTHNTRIFFEEEPISQGVQKTAGECNVRGCVFLKFHWGNANVCVGRLFFRGKKRRRIIMVKVIHG